MQHGKHRSHDAFGRDLRGITDGARDEPPAIDYLGEVLEHLSPALEHRRAGTQRVEQPEVRQPGLLVEQRQQRHQPRTDAVAPALLPLV
jgi:hypothetical protein